MLARDEFDVNGPVEAKVIEEFFVRQGEIFNVHVGGEVIETTPEHPFYVKGKGWTSAGELEIGDLVASEKDTWLPIEDLLATGELDTVYNLRVADFHTYFVGNRDAVFNVWVHNACRLRQISDSAVLTEEAMEFRRTVAGRIRNPHDPRVSSRLVGGNVSVLEYFDESTNTTRYIRRFSRGDNAHAERRAWSALVRRLGSEAAAQRAVRRVYTELSPCPRCQRWLNTIASSMERDLGRDLPIYYTYFYQSRSEYAAFIRRNSEWFERTFP